MYTLVFFMEFAIDYEHDLMKHVGNFIAKLGNPAALSVCLYININMFTIL